MLVFAGGFVVAALQKTRADNVIAKIEGVADTGTISALRAAKDAWSAFAAFSAVATIITSLNIAALIKFQNNNVKQEAQ